MHIINPSGSRQFSGRNGAVSATRVQRSFAIRPPNTETASLSLPLTTALGLSALLPHLTSLPVVFPESSLWTSSLAPPLTGACFEFQKQSASLGLLTGCNYQLQSI